MLSVKYDLEAEFSSATSIRNEIVCKIDNKGALSGYTFFSQFFSLYYVMKWHIGVKQ